MVGLVSDMWFSFRWLVWVLMVGLSQMVGLVSDGWFSFRWLVYFRWVV